MANNLVTWLSSTAEPHSTNTGPSLKVSRNQSARAPPPARSFDSLHWFGFTTFIPDSISRMFGNHCNSSSGNHGRVGLSQNSTRTRWCPCGVPSNIIRNGAPHFVTYPHMLFPTYGFFFLYLSKSPLKGSSLYICPKGDEPTQENKANLCFRCPFISLQTNPKLGTEPPTCWFPSKVLVWTIQIILRRTSKVGRFKTKNGYRAMYTPNHHPKGHSLFFRLVFFWETKLKPN